jgi:gliding motility-associated-like protein
MAERLANFTKEIRLIYSVLLTLYLFTSGYNAFSQCTASVGTFNLTSNGFLSQGVLTLAFGDQATINSNNNWTPPPQGSNTTVQYNPDIIWLIYSCPPSIALTPDPNVFITSDPCLKSVINARNLIVNGTLSLINAFPAGTFSQNIVYLVPITAYNRAVDPIIVTLTNPRCYQMGTPVPVQFLPDVSINQTQNCVAGTVTATVSGGLPSLDGSQFSVIQGSLSPAHANFINTSASNNGTITIGGLKKGDTYSFDIQDNKGSNTKVTGTFAGLTPTTIAYSKSSYCTSDTGPSPTLTGTPGGTYSSDSGLSINGSTGIVDPQTSTPGTYTITYNPASGVCEAPSTFSLTINGLPGINAGTDQIVCSGNTLTLNATGGVSYNWDNGISDGVSFVPNSTAIYTVTGIDANNCSNTDQVQVTLTSKTVPSFDPIPAICSGDPLTIPSTSKNSITGSWSPIVSNTATTTYTFTPASGECATTATLTVTVTPGSTPTFDSIPAICSGGSFSLPTTSKNSITGSWSPAMNNTTTTTYTFTPSASQCVSTTTLTVTVNPLPSVNAGSDIILCAGQTVTLTPTGAISFSWDNGVTNGLAFTPTSSGTYTVTGVDVNNCTNTDQLQITVNSLPNVNAGADQSICAGQSVNLTASGATSYSWDNGITDGVPFSPLSSGTYTVTGTGANSCINTDQVTITVNPLPNVNAGADKTVCTGQSITLSATGGSSYVWDNGVTNGVSFVPNTTTIFTVTGTDANNCQNTDEVLVTVGQMPSVQFTSDTTKGCIPLTVTFTNASVGSNLCTWNFGDGTTVTGCSGVTHTFTKEGCFDVSLSVASSSTCSTSDTITDMICIEKAPVAIFSASSSIVTEFDNKVDFINESKNAIAYNWSFGDNSDTTNVEDPSHIYPSAEDETFWTVRLAVASELGCRDTAYTSIYFQEELIFFVPNAFSPNDDIYNQTYKPIFTSGFDPSDFNMKIFNRWGEIVFETNDASTGWDGSYGSNGEVAELDEGIYVWKLEFKMAKNDERKEFTGHVNLLR